MSLEVNILHHLADCLERKHGVAAGGIKMTSPTQNEEASLAFDAMVEQPDGCYLLLQFKRPSLGRDMASFKVPAKQVCTLLQWPRGSAFFVLPAAKTNKDVGDAGPSLLAMSRIVDAWDLYAPFDGIGLLDKARGGRSESAGRAVRVYKDGGTEVNVTKGRGWTGQGVASIPISRLCGTGAYGVRIENGAAWTQSGEKWGPGGWERKAREMWRRIKGPGREHEYVERIPAAARSVWADRGIAKEEPGKDAPPPDGAAYLVGVACSGPGKG